MYLAWEVRSGQSLAKAGKRARLLRDKKFSVAELLAQILDTLICAKSLQEVRDSNEEELDEVSVSKRKRSLYQRNSGKGQRKRRSSYIAEEQEVVGRFELGVKELLLNQIVALIKLTELLKFPEDDPFAFSD